MIHILNIETIHCYCNGNFHYNIDEKLESYYGQPYSGNKTYGEIYNVLEDSIYDRSILVFDGIITQIDEDTYK